MSGDAPPRRMRLPSQRQRQIAQDEQELYEAAVRRATEDSLLEHELASGGGGAAAGRPTSGRPKRSGKGKGKPNKRAPAVAAASALRAFDDSETVWGSSSGTSSAASVASSSSVTASSPASRPGAGLASASAHASQRVDTATRVDTEARPPRCPPASIPTLSRAQVGRMDKYLKQIAYALAKDPRAGMHASLPELTSRIVMAAIARCHRAGNEWEESDDLVMQCVLKKIESVCFVPCKRKGKHGDRNGTRSVFSMNMRNVRNNLTKQIRAHLHDQDSVNAVLLLKPLGVQAAVSGPLRKELHAFVVENYTQHVFEVALMLVLLMHRVAVVGYDSTTRIIFPSIRSFVKSNEEGLCGYTTYDDCVEFKNELGARAVKYLRSRIGPEIESFFRYCVARAALIRPELYGIAGARTPKNPKKGGEQPPSLRELVDGIKTGIKQRDLWSDEYFAAHPDALNPTRAPLRAPSLERRNQSPAPAPASAGTASATGATGDVAPVVSGVGRPLQREQLLAKCDELAEELQILKEDEARAVQAAEATSSPARRRRAQRATSEREDVQEELSRTEQLVVQLDAAQQRSTLQRQQAQRAAQAPAVGRPLDGADRIRWLKQQLQEAMAAEAEGPMTAEAEGPAAPAARSKRAHPAAEPVEPGSHPSPRKRRRFSIDRGASGEGEKTEDEDEDGAENPVGDGGQGE